MNVEVSPSIGICVNGSPVHLLGPVVFLSDGPQEIGVVAEGAGVGGIGIDSSPVHLFGPVVLVSDGPQEVGIIPEAVRVGGSYADDLFVHPLSSIIVATDFIDVVINEVDVTSKSTSI